MSDQFKEIPATDPISDVIRSAFDLSIPVEGGWGYTIDTALKLLPPLPVPLTQTEYTLASMRTHIEMHMTLPDDQRYGGINLNELFREEKVIENRYYDIVSYEVTAMRESDYTHFIEAYKEGYGKDDFDISAHFEARKAATLTRKITLYFDTTDVR